MPGYLYSSCFGSFIFDDSLKIADKVLFSDILKSNSLLEKKEWLPEEEQLVKKHSPKFFIGQKKEKKFGVELTHDLELLSLVAAALKARLPDIYSANILITKHRLKEAVTDDILIIQSTDTLDALNKAINTLVKRLREWYGLYNPEFSGSLDDHEKFVEIILKSPKLELLKQINLDPRHTMGADLPQADIEPILSLAEKISELYKLKALETEYLEKKMQILAPNMSAITGYLLGAKLLSFAGSMKRLSELPSSTIQLLGAEKALFRHITKNSLPPKYGVLHEHPFISKARREDHGKVARTLADKISIAVKVDYFKGAFIGDKLKADLDKRFGK